MHTTISSVLLELVELVELRHAYLHARKHAVHTRILYDMYTSV